MKAKFVGNSEDLALTYGKDYDLTILDGRLGVSFDNPFGSDKFKLRNPETENGYLPFFYLVYKLHDWSINISKNSEINIVELDNVTVDSVLQNMNGYDDVLEADQNREPWPVYFMRMAERAGDRTTCKSRNVGAVFVKDKIDIMKGYNGVPPGFEHPTSCKRKDLGCKSGERLDLCPCNHAERNAINNAAKHGIALNGSTVYVTTKPCFGCMGDMAVAGVAKVVYLNDYAHEVTDLIASKAKIEIVRFQDELFKYILSRMQDYIKTFD